MLKDDENLRSLRLVGVMGATMWSRICSVRGYGSLLLFRNSSIVSDVVDVGGAGIEALGARMEAMVGFFLKTCLGLGKRSSIEVGGVDGMETADFSLDVRGVESALTSRP